MLELVRRGALLALWFAVVLRVVVGDVCPIGHKPARRSPARPKGYELRTIRPIGRRLVAIRVQVLLA